MTLAQQLYTPAQQSTSAVEAWATSAAQEAASVSGWDGASVTGGAPYQDYLSVRAESEAGEAALDPQYGYSYPATAPQTAGDPQQQQTSFQYADLDAAADAPQAEAAPPHYAGYDAGAAADAPQQEASSFAAAPPLDAYAVAGTSFDASANYDEGAGYQASEAAESYAQHTPADPLMASNTSSQFDAIRAGEGRSRSGSVHSQR